MIESYEEFLHLIKQAVQQQTGDYRPFVYGHVASYDPALHRIRAIIPTLRDDTDVPVLSPWIPLGTLGVGGGYGVQIAPVGGATYDNPTAGEQVQITISDPEYGTGLGAHLAFNQTQTPPFTTLQGGEIAIKNIGGSYLLLHANGDVEVTNPQGNTSITTHGNTTITSQGTLTATADTVNINGSNGDVVVSGISLVHHVHGGVRAGSDDTGEPVGGGASV